MFEIKQKTDISPNLVPCFLHLSQCCPRLFLHQAKDLTIHFSCLKCCIRCVPCRHTKINFAWKCAQHDANLGSAVRMCVPPHKLCLLTVLHHKVLKLTYTHQNVFNYIVWSRGIWMGWRPVYQPIQTTMKDPSVLCWTGAMIKRETERRHSCHWQVLTVLSLAAGVF